MRNILQNYCPVFFNSINVMKDKGKEKPRSCHTLWDTRDMTAKGNVGARTRENEVEENTGETRIRSVD